MAVDSVIRRLSRRKLPEDDAKAKNISLFRIFVPIDDLGRHPLVSADFGGHDLGFDAGPAEIGEFTVQRMVEKDVETFEISVENGLFICVQVVHTFGDVEGKLLSVLPRHFDVLVVKQAPERAS